MGHDVHAEAAEPCQRCAGFTPYLRNGGGPGGHFQHRYFARAAVDVEAADAEDTQDREPVYAVGCT